ncbi:MAG: hypothetical protein AAFX94_05510, partial [Myxococcota bacterium]
KQLRWPPSDTGVEPLGSSLPINEVPYARSARHRRECPREGTVFRARDPSRLGGAFLGHAARAPALGDAAELDPGGAERGRRAGAVGNGGAGGSPAVWFAVK